MEARPAVAAPGSINCSLIDGPKSGEKFYSIALEATDGASLNLSRHTDRERRRLGVKKTFLFFSQLGFKSLKVAADQLKQC